MKSLLVFGLFVSSFALASGWDCNSQGAEWGVELYNHTNPKLGTPNPAKFTLFQNGEAIVHRFGQGLEVFSTSKGTTYSVRKTKELDSCDIHFHIGFREAVDSIPAGTIRIGTLSLVCKGEETESVKLRCKRYLKNP